MAIKLVIEMAEKKSKYVTNQIEIDYTEFDVLKKIFSVAEDDPKMYNSYKLDNEINNKLWELVGIKINLDVYDCYAGYRRCT